MNAFEGLLPDRVLDAGEPTRARYPDEQGFARPFISGAHHRYEAIENFSPNHWRQDYRAFVESFARWIASHPHSTSGRASGRTAVEA
jgi:hypothetical protein